MPNISKELVLFIKMIVRQLILNNNKLSFHNNKMTGVYELNTCHFVIL